MRLLANFPHDLPPAVGEHVATLGVFDGLHLGHQALLRAALEVAAGRPVAVVTFDPHPRAVLGPPKRHRLLAPLDERLDLLSQWNVATVAVLRFDRAIAQLPYAEFVRRALVEGLGARHLVLGYNLRLGFEQQGTPERLEALGHLLGYETTLVPAVLVDGEPVSSTRVRHLLDAGRVEAAERLLGRPYDIAGTVIRGSGRGRSLGIPTANLEVAADKLLPAHGVYAVTADVGGRRLRAALNIGTVPTFRTDRQTSVEVHLLDFDGDLYGTRLRVLVRARLRGEARFPGPGPLVEQVRRDLEAVRLLADSESWQSS